jgi:hypothetical protein
MPRLLLRSLVPFGLVLLLLVPVAQAQGVLSDEASEHIEGVGWEGFLDYEFLLHAVLVLALATALGAAIAFHPRAFKRIDSLEEAEAPKVYITYAVVGAVTGLMVVQYGLVVGFVVFGIGGLFRFRTALPSVAHTGRLILVTLVGLACGLDLPHLGVLATAFGYVLFFILEHSITCSLEVKDLDNKRLKEASVAYRALIEQQKGRIIRQERSFSKKEVKFLFRAPNTFDWERLERDCDEQVPPELRGTLDWEVD